MLPIHPAIRVLVFVSRNDKLRKTSWIRFFDYTVQYTVHSSTQSWFYFALNLDDLSNNFNEFLIVLFVSADPPELNSVLFPSTSKCVTTREEQYDGRNAEVLTCVVLVLEPCSNYNHKLSDDMFERVLIDICLYFIIGYIL